MKLGNLAARVATAVVLVPGIIALIQWKNPAGLWALVFVATLLCLHEFFGMTLSDVVERRVGLVLGGLLAAGLYYRPFHAWLLMPAAVAVPALFYLFRFRDLTTVIPRLSAMSFGLLYAGMLLPFVSLMKKMDPEHGGDWAVLILTTAWFADTGAYFAGRFLGKSKLYPAISPGKTWAGAIGGLAGSLGAGALANAWFFPELGWVHGIVVTLVGSALGQSGDLVESMLKRAAGVKDSGQILPGHGGMLDRIDAVLFIAPWVAIYRFYFWQ